MSVIPVLDGCRYTTIAQIKERIEQDNFTYKSVRILGKIRQLQDQTTGMAVFESVDQGDESNEIMVDTYQLKNRSLEVGKTYELLGEIEQVSPQAAL